MPYIKRELEEKIRKYLDSPEIIAVTGPRQSGKTTLIEHEIKNLENVNKVTFDDINTLEMFEHDTDDFIGLHVEEYDYLFIDEIQYSDKSGEKLKYIYDTTETKILISGSSSTEMAVKSLKRLVGRVFIFELLPLNFREYLRYKAPKLSKLENPGSTAVKKINKHLDKFIKYGGYPRVATAEGEEKKEVLKNIYNTYFLKEIKEILQLKEDYKLSKLIKALAHQTGGIINYNELSDITETKYKKLKKNLNVLDKTYICKRAQNHHSNKKTELKKSPKIYFIDTGFRNAALQEYPQPTGELYENFIASEILKKGYELKYWRTKSKAEVDFVIKGIPVEVKTNNPKVTKSYRSYLKQYNPSKGIIFSKQGKKTETVEGTKILFLPFSEVTRLEKHIEQN